LKISNCKYRLIILTPFHFTSGSSGIPKGMLAYARGSSKNSGSTTGLDYAKTDRVLTFGALSSTGGMSNVYRSIIAGATVDFA